MPDSRACPVLDTGHPDVVPTKVGNHLKDWVPVFTGNPGFRMEFTPLQNGAGIDDFFENCWFLDRLYLLLPLSSSSIFSYSRFTNSPPYFLSTGER